MPRSTLDPTSRREARSAHHARLLAATAVLGFVLLTSCRRNTDEKSGDGPNAGGFDKAALLRAFGECAMGTYGEFHSVALELAAATQKAERANDAASRQAAQETWKRAMDLWQRAELFGFGPLAATPAPGARDLRDPIYAWPLVNRCVVEQGIVSQSYDKPEFANGLVSTRSLSAVELLLFEGGPDNACPPEASINAQGSWKAIPPDELAHRRAAYARAAAADAAAHSQMLVDAWDPAKGNFFGTFVGAGKNDTFKTQQMAFNAVSDAAFYIDDFVKNMKVGRPSGLLPECAKPPCLDQVESQWAHRAKDHLKSNLVGFEKIMRGCGPSGEGLGFDDLLVAVGAEATSKKILDAISASRAALDALVEPTFEQDITKNPEGVKRLFDALRVIVSTMKSEFSTVLDLELPKRVEGDND